MNKTAQELIEAIFSKLEHAPEASISMDEDGDMIIDELPTDVVEISEEEDPQIIVMPELLGVSGPIEEIVIEEDEDEEDEDENESDSQSNAPKDKWDWEAYGPEGFVPWVQERVNSVPRHSGVDTAGLERAIAYMEKLDKEISTAMRLDLDGELPHEKIEVIRQKIEDGLDSLENRLERVKQRKKKKAFFSVYDSQFVKNAGSTKINGISATVPLLILGLCKICINSKVSAGHDLEETFATLAKKYKLDEREKMEMMLLLKDMGYPLRLDRGLFGDEDIDLTSSDNFDFAASYQS